jgi:hypothetical protein
VELNYDAEHCIKLFEEKNILKMNRISIQKLNYDAEKCINLFEETNTLKKNRISIQMNDVTKL